MAATIFVIGTIGTSTGVWAAKSTPMVEDVVTEQILTDSKALSAEANGTIYDYTFEALSFEQQNRVSKEMAHYYLDEQGNVVYFTDLNTESVPFETLTTEQQRQTMKEIGHYGIY